MKNSINQPYSFQQKMKAMKGMLFALNRGKELERLICWAHDKYLSRRGKRFMYIQIHYEECLDKVEHRLSMLRQRFPKQYWLALTLHLIGNLLSVKPVFYPGSAADHLKEMKSPRLTI